MSYPRLSHSDVKEFIETVVRPGATDASVTRFLAGKNVDESKHKNAQLSGAVERLLADCGTLRDKDLEPIEARHCGPVYKAIEEKFGDQELGDVQFWSFLAVRYFWKFVSYRQAAAWSSARGEAADPGSEETERAKLERYLLGKDHYQIPLRMYLRAQAVRVDDDFSLTEIRGGGTDFWRSQVLGVRTSMFPPLARAVARQQDAMELNIDQQRPAGRRVNRLRVNVEFVLHNDVDAADATAGLWVVTDSDTATLADKKAAKKAARSASTPKAAPKGRTLEGARPSSTGTSPKASVKSSITAESSEDTAPEPTAEQAQATGGRRRRSSET